MRIGEKSSVISKTRRVFLPSVTGGRQSWPIRCIKHKAGPSGIIGMSEQPPLDRSKTKSTNLSDHDNCPYVASATPAERIEMVWPLTVEAWSLKDPLAAGKPMRRDIARIRKLCCEENNAPN